MHDGFLPVQGLLCSETMLVGPALCRYTRFRRAPSIWWKTWVPCKGLAVIIYLAAIFCLPYFGLVQFCKTYLELLSVDSCDTQGVTNIPVDKIPHNPGITRHLPYSSFVGQTVQYYLRLISLAMTAQNNCYILFYWQDEKRAALKCGTFGASSLQQRYLATGDFEGKMMIWCVIRTSLCFICDEVFLSNLCRLLTT